MILFHIHDAGARPPRQRRLNEVWTVVALSFDELDGVAASQVRNCLFDVDLTKLATALRIRAFLGNTRPKGLRIFASRRGNRHAAIQAGALGATHLVDRPARDEAVLAVLPEEDPGPAAADDTPSESAVLATLALDVAFRRFETGERLLESEVGSASVAVAREIGSIGLSTWLRPIVTHHVGTYQHCLTVTGLATAFGQALGFGAADMADLTIAALLHDVGKARIPSALLDKPSALTRAERTLFQQHPVWGHDYLAARSNTSPRVQRAVRGHHEYLDGSGYPDGLRGRQIDDLTRLLTIADIFGALIEKRSYKAAMPTTDAFAILRQMAAAGRIERALVEAFAPVVGVMPNRRSDIRAA